MISNKKKSIDKGLLELGSKLRSDQYRNKASMANSPTQKAFNRMGMKLHAGQIRSLYNKSGFKKPTGSQLVAGFNKAKVTAARVAKNTAAFQPQTGQSMVSAYSENNINTSRLLNTSITKPYTTKVKEKTKTGINTSNLLSGKVTTKTNKMGEMELFNARMRKIHKLRGITVNKKNRTGYAGY